MSTRRVKLRQWDKRRGTEKAHLFIEPNTLQELWIPKSLVHHISRDMPDVNGIRSCVVDVEEWFADKEDL